jgi:hypothetical protein
LADIRAAGLGTLFDVGSGESRRINGIRNIRQALASPYPAAHSPIRRGSFSGGSGRSAPPGELRENTMTSPLSRLAVIAVLSAAVSACGLGLRNPNISELKNNPGRYQDRSVHIDGVVTSSWGVPLVPFRMYRIDDGTGEVTVLSNNSRTPTRGARVRVRGKVNEVGVFGGQALGLHLREERLDIRRGD